MNKLFGIIKRFFNEDEIKFSQESKVEMDSRKINEGDIFFAINNGNNHIEEVLLKNPSLIISDSKDIKIEDKRIFYVEDTVKTMQDIARLYRRELKAKVIGITGSNGKTTTKDILFSVVSKMGKAKKTFGNYNNHIGLPFTMLTTGEEIEYLILEMGMSDLGEIDLLCNIAQPDYGLITNIGITHIANLKNRETVFLAKTEMLKYVKNENMFVNSDDDLLEKINSNHVGFNMKNIINTEAGLFNYRLCDLDETEGEQIFSFVEIIGNSDTKKSKIERYKMNLNGAYNTLNAGLVVALTGKIGASSKIIKEGLLNVELTPMRFEKNRYDGIICINDAYNASPISMELGIKSFENVYRNNYKIAIIADMLELGTDEITYHEKVLKEILLLEIDEILLYGPIMGAAYKRISNIKTNVIFKEFSNKKILTEYLRDKLERLGKESAKDIALYLKGSRGMKLEEIINVLFNK